MDKDEVAVDLKKVDRGVASETADAQARKEENALLANRLEAAEHSRQIRYHLHYLMIATIWIVFAFYFVAASIWFWHLVTPWGYLEESQSDKLHSLLLGSIVGGLAGQFIHKIRSAYLDMKK